MFFIDNDSALAMRELASAQQSTDLVPQAAQPQLVSLPFQSPADDGACETYRDAGRDEGNHAISRSFTQYRGSDEATIRLSPPQPPPPPPRQQPSRPQQQSTFFQHGVLKVKKTQQPQHVEIDDDFEQLRELIFLARERSVPAPMQSTTAVDRATTTTPPAPRRCIDLGPVQHNHNTPRHYPTRNDPHYTGPSAIPNPLDYFRNIQQGQGGVGCGVRDTRSTTRSTSSLLVPSQESLLMIRDRNIQLINSSMRQDSRLCSSNVRVWICCLCNASVKVPPTPAGGLLILTHLVSATCLVIHVDQILAERNQSGKPLSETMLTYDGKRQVIRVYENVLLRYMEVTSSVVPETWKCLRCMKSIQRNHSAPTLLAHLCTCVGAETIRSELEKDLCALATDQFIMQREVDIEARSAIRTDKANAPGQLRTNGSDQCSDGTRGNGVMTPSGGHVILPNTTETAKSSASQGSKNTEFAQVFEPPISSIQNPSSRETLLPSPVDNSRKEDIVEGVHVASSGMFVDSKSDSCHNQSRDELQQDKARYQSSGDVGPCPLRTTNNKSEDLSAESRHKRALDHLSCRGTTISATTETTGVQPLEENVVRASKSGTSAQANDTMNEQVSVTGLDLAINTHTSNNTTYATTANTNVADSESSWVLNGDAACRTDGKTGTDGTSQCNEAVRQRGDSTGESNHKRSFDNTPCLGSRTSAAQTVEEESREVKGFSGRKRDISVSVQSRDELNEDVTMPDRDPAENICTSSNATNATTASKGAYSESALALDKVKESARPSTEEQLQGEELTSSVESSESRKRSASTISCASQPVDTDKTDMETINKGCDDAADNQDTCTADTKDTCNINKDDETPPDGNVTESCSNSNIATACNTGSSVPGEQKGTSASGEDIGPPTEKKLKHQHSSGEEATSGETEDYANESQPLGAATEPGTPRQPDQRLCGKWNRFYHLWD